MTAPDVPPEAGPRPRVRVRLYIAGDAPNSVAACANLRAELARRPAGHVEAEFIDVLKEPERSARDRVFMTPMLVRFEPAPERRVLGNLCDRALLVSVLGLDVASDE